jgi:hypothetical protein
MIRSLLLTTALTLRITIAIITASTYLALVFDVVPVAQVQPAQAVQSVSPLPTPTPCLLWLPQVPTFGALPPRLTQWRFDE